MASVRRLAPVGVPLAVLVLSGVASAQDPLNAPRPDVSPLWRAVGNFVITLVIGGGLLTWGYNYVGRIDERIREDPGVSFLWGLATLVLFVVSSVVLVLLLGVLGRMLFVALVIAFVIIAVVGHVLAYLTLFGVAVESQWTALGLAATIGSVVPFVPIVGSILSFLLTSVGTGAIVWNYRA